jgi:ATPase subunit of ABC transporter with duplicated ATPase domains
VHEHARAVAAAAAAEIDRRQDDWRPLATEVAAWATAAREATAVDARAAQAEKAEKWLTATAQAVELERFTPISEAVQQYWERLRLSSNVALAGVEMKRSGTSRSLALDVTVDDTGASALGVMSQGELHALALSVFLPRATSDASPFRFLVLDDPVQAMDPARVDGLAEVLADVAQHRQVIVMTHDTRLPDAVRRLQIPATVYEVHRRPRSQVGIRKVDDPVERYIDDARAIARTRELSAKSKAQLVALMGRGALEAVSMELVRRRRLARGESHDQVEAVLAGKAVHDLVALAVFDRDDRGGDLLQTLRTWFDGYPAVLQDCKRGTHVGEREIDDDAFVRHLDGLVKRLRTEAA